MVKRDSPAAPPPGESPSDALRRIDLEDAEVAHTASIRRHGRRAVLAVVIGGIFGTFAGEVGPQAYSIAAGFVGWGALAGTRVIRALNRRMAVREERATLPPSQDTRS
jgi:hypothetical protein